MVSHSAGNDPAAVPASTMEYQEIFNNINGLLHGHMSGFIRKFFRKFQYVHQGASLEIQAAGQVTGRWVVPSAGPSPGDFLS